MGVPASFRCCNIVDKAHFMMPYFAFRLQKHNKLRILDYEGPIPFQY